MEFNTGSSGGGTPPPPPTRTGPSGGPGGNNEFNLSNPVGSFIRAVREIVLHPVLFYRGMRKSGDYASPLIFVVICGLIYGILGGLISFISSVSGDVGVGFALLSFIGSIILTPIFAVIATFVAALIIHLFVLLFARSTNAGYEATLRAYSYTYVSLLIGWIPLVNILAGIYSIVLFIIGIREAHNTSTGRAVAIVLIPVVVLFLLALIFFAALIAAIVMGSQGA